MNPCVCRYINAIEDAEYRGQKIDFWDDVYGFDMSCIKRMALLEPLVETVIRCNEAETHVGRKYLTLVFVAFLIGVRRPHVQ